MRKISHAAVNESKNVWSVVDCVDVIKPSVTAAAMAAFIVGLNLVSSLHPCFIICTRATNPVFGVIAI